VLVGRNECRNTNKLREKEGYIETMEKMFLFRVTELNSRFGWAVIGLFKPIELLLYFSMVQQCCYLPFSSLVMYIRLHLLLSHGVVQTSIWRGRCALRLLRHVSV
jgi:hypothetical protein